MLELFSRTPDGMNPPSYIHLVPISIDDEVDSLSAILLDSDYYSFLHACKIEQDGLSIIIGTPVGSKFLHSYPPAGLG